MSRNFSKSRAWDDKRRGHPVFVLEQKRWPPDRLVSSQAAQRTWETSRHLTCGAYDGCTGDGEAWKEIGWYVGAFFKRPIKGGKWAGPWKRAPA